MNKLQRLFISVTLSFMLFMPFAMTHAAADMLPNLQPKPAYELSLQSDFHGGYLLRLSTLTWNSGLGPLQLKGGAINADETQNVLQEIFRDDGSSYTNLAGVFIFHDAHGHIHLEDYADYVLTSADPNNNTLRLGNKTSFCIIDTDKIDRHLEGAPNRSTYNTCDSEVQGMSVGWGDAYRSHLPGQSIDVSGLASGEYYLTIVSDPQNNILETNENDNESTILIYLDMAALTVNILDGTGGEPSDPPAPPGDVIVESIIPATIFANQSQSVTINGSGFSAGMPLSLTNGVGPAPKFSNINVIDDTTITATVTTKKGGPPKTRTWDVIVDTGILEGGYTVFP